MTGLTNPFFDPVLGDFVLGLGPGELLAVDAPTERHLLTSEFIHNSKWGARRASPAAAFFLGAARSKSRMSAIGGADLRFGRLDSLLAGPTQPLDTVYVATTDAELATTRALRRTLEDRGCRTQVVSLKNQVHAAIAGNGTVDEGLSALLEPIGTEPATFTIVSAPRSGSFLLCELAEKQGLGAPDEHLRHPVSVALRRRSDRTDFDLGVWLNSVRQARGNRGTGWFGTKLIAHFIEAVVRSATDAEVEVLARMLRNGLIVRLNRRNKVAQAVSAFRASHSGVFQATSDAALDRHRQSPAVYSYDQIHEHMVRLEGQEDFLDRFLSRHALKPYIADYEDLVDDASSVMRHIADITGVPYVDDTTVDRNLKLADPLSREFEARFRRDAGLAPQS